METHYFWAFFVIALIGGGAISLAVSNATITGYQFRFPFFQRIAPEPTTIQPAPEIAPSEAVPDAISMLKSSVVFHVYPVISQDCNKICAERSAICVDAFVEETGQNNLRPVECNYKVNNKQDVYCRCASSRPIEKVTAYEEFAGTEFDKFVRKNYGNLAAFPANTWVYRKSTNGRLVAGYIEIEINPSKDPRVFANNQCDCRMYADGSKWHFYAPADGWVKID